MEKVWHQWYDKGVPKRIAYPQVPLKGLFNVRAEENAADPYLIIGNQIIPYGEANTLARRTANGLLDLGVSKGDRVALIAPNVPQWVIARQACYKIGAIVVPINPLSAQREMDHHLADSGAETAIVMAPFAEKLLGFLKKEANPLKRLILFGQSEPTDGSPQEPGLHFLEKMMASAQSNEPDVFVDPQDVAVIQYTGGTTGISKGCALTNYNLVAMALQTVEWMKPVVEGRDIRTLAAIPIYHVYGYNFNVNLNIFAGGSVVLIPKPTPDALLEAINTHQPTLFPSVPTMLIGLIQHPAIRESRVDRIKSVICGGAPLARETMTAFEKLSKTRIMEGYGLSEISNVVTANPGTKRKEGSIGVPWPDVDVKVVDIDEGKTTMPVGEPGELLLKTPTLMAGYWNRPSETENAIRDGWLYTGDVVYQDEDGFIFIVDRKKDMILASGFNIYPREIDEVMYTHPKVLHSCTVGVPDPVRGETVKVFLQLKEGETMDEEEVVAYCRERLTPYKVPKIVEFIDEIPLTSVGKADRKALRERG